MKSILVCTSILGVAALAACSPRERLFGQGGGGSGTTSSGEMHTASTGTMGDTSSSTSTSVTSTGTNTTSTSTTSTSTSTSTSASSTSSGMMCPTGQAACGGKCIDVQADKTNCGGCGVTCPAFAACSAGLCMGCDAGKALTESMLGIGGTASDGFGQAVATSGGLIVVGAPYGANGGGAWVLDDGAGQWLSTTLTPNGGVTAGMNFGAHVALSGSTAVVSAVVKSLPTVFVFVQQGLAWFQKATISPPVTASTNVTAPYVAIDGSTIVIATSSGIYPYSGSGATWTSQGTVVPTDPNVYLLAPSISGDTIVAPGEIFDTTGNAAHFGYVFKRTGSTWAQEAQLIPSGLASNTSPSFHFSAAVDGNSAAIATSVGAYVFTRSGTTWSQLNAQPLKLGTSSDFGNAVAMSGKAILGGAVNSVGSPGHAYLLGESTSDLALAATLVSGASGDSYGSSVAVSKGLAVVGAPVADAIYVYSCAP